MAARQSNGLADIIQIRGAPGLEPIDIGAGADRPLDSRAVAGDELQPEPHRLQRQQEIGEDDRRIHV